MISNLKVQHVVIAGAGYAGLPCALGFRSFPRDRVRVTLVNPEPRQELTCELFRTLRTGAPEQFAFRKHLRGAGVDYEEGWVDAIDPSQKTLLVRGERKFELKYDHLILATGLQLRAPPLPGLEEHLNAAAPAGRRVFTFKSNADAQNLRLALKRLGWAADARPPSGRDRFAVVVGAGPTGIEVAGEIAALRARNPRLRVVLVDRAPELLPDFSPLARRLFKQELSRMRIETVLGTAVARVGPEELHTDNGQAIPWDLLVLCTGARQWPRSLEAFQSIAGPEGLRVRRDLELEGFRDHYAIGDLAALANVAKRAQFAVQAGGFMARRLAEKAMIVSKAKPGPSRFEPTDWGYFVSLGPLSGLGRLGPAPGGTVGRLLSPFLIGPPVEQAKRAVKLKYLLQLRTGWL